MKTAAVLIGNSDDKLPQCIWSKFVEAVDTLVLASASHVFFTGYSNPVASWQNTCWVFQADDGALDRLRQELVKQAVDYGQDSIALVVGETQLLGKKD